MKTLSGQLRTGEMCGGGTVQLLDGVTILVGAQCSVSQLQGSQHLHPPPGSGKADLTSLSQPGLDLIGKSVFLGLQVPLHLMMLLGNLGPVLSNLFSFFF